MRNTYIDYNGWRIFDYAYILLFCKEILCIDVQVFIGLSLKKYQKYFQKHQKKNPKYIYFKVGWTKIFRFE